MQGGGGTRLSRGVSVLLSCVRSASCQTCARRPWCQGLFDWRWLGRVCRSWWGSFSRPRFRRALCIHFQGWLLACACGDAMHVLQSSNARACLTFRREFARNDPPHWGRWQTEYDKHVAERAALGVVPAPINAKQCADLVKMLENPPKGEEDFLLNLITHRVPPGVDDAAYVKADFLTAIVKGLSFFHFSCCFASPSLRLRPLTSRLSRAPLDLFVLF